jgi:hypothetical protein
MKTAMNTYMQLFFRVLISRVTRQDEEKPRFPLVPLSRIPNKKEKTMPHSPPADVLFAAVKPGR